MSRKEVKALLLIGSSSEEETRNILHLLSGECKEYIWYKIFIQSSMENRGKLFQEDQSLAINLFHRYEDKEGLALIIASDAPFSERRIAAKALFQLTGRFCYGLLKDEEDYHPLVQKASSETSSHERPFFLYGLHGTETHPKKYCYGTMLGRGFAMMEGKDDYDRI